MALNQIAVLGPGLLGGSIGLAVKKRGLGDVRFWGRSEEKLSAVLERGFFASIDLAEVVRGADLVILATPVEFFDGLAQQLIVAGGDFVVSDVGSVKGSVEEGCGQKLRAAGFSFVGSHPMAGSEQGGFGAAKEDLFEGATCFICPKGDGDEGGVVKEFWEALGCVVEVVAADVHDQTVARISHLPPALASVTAKVALRKAGEGAFGGGGLGDTTRVASGNPEMWTGILLENQKAVLEELKRASEEVATLRELLTTEDRVGLLSWLREAKLYRDQLNGS